MQANEQFELRINNQPFSYLYTQGSFSFNLKNPIEQHYLEKVKKEFTYEDDIPKKDYDRKEYAGSGGAGGGWDEVRKAKNEQPQKNYMGFGSDSNAGGFNKPSGGFGQPTTGAGAFGQSSAGGGGFISGFEKFDIPSKKYEFSFFYIY